MKSEDMEYGTFEQRKTRLASERKRRRRALIQISVEESTEAKHKELIAKNVERQNAIKNHETTVKVKLINGEYFRHLSPEQRQHMKEQKAKQILIRHPQMTEMEEEITSDDNQSIATPREIRRALKMNEKKKGSGKLKMKHAEETDTVNIDSSDDKSLRLCTKNVNGQMYLVMEPENENSVLSDASVETDTANTLEIDADSSMQTETVEEEDSEISVVLLNDSKPNENSVNDHSFLDKALTVPSSTTSTSTPVVLPTISPSVLTDSSNNSNIVSLLPSSLGESMTVNGNSATVSFPIESIPFTTNIKKEPEIEPVSAIAPSSCSLPIKSKLTVPIVQAVGTNSGSLGRIVKTETSPQVSTLFHPGCSADSSSICRVPISSPTGKKLTVDVNKTANAPVAVPKNIIVKCSQPLSQVNLKNILYSFGSILNVVSRSSTQPSSGKIPSKVTHAVLTNGTSTVYSASDANMSSSVSSPVINVFSPKSTSAPSLTLAQTTTTKTENQSKMSPVPISNLPKKVYVVPVSLPSNNSQIVQLTMASTPQTVPVSSPVTSFKYVLNAPSVTPIQQGSQNSSLITKPTFVIGNPGTTTMSTTSSAFPLQTGSLGSVLNNSNQTPSQMTPCVLLSTLVNQTTPTVTTEGKTILHNGYVSSNIFQTAKSSNSSISTNVPMQSNSSKETVIKSSELILSNGVTNTPKTPTTNLAVLWDTKSASCKSSYAVTNTTSSYNLNKGICTIPKVSSTADGTCMTKTQQIPMTSSKQVVMSTNTYTSFAGDKMPRLILTASSSDNRKSTLKNSTIEQNLQEVFASTTNIAHNAVNRILLSGDSVKDSSTNLTSKIIIPYNFSKLKKVSPRPLAPKSEIYPVNSSTSINPLSSHIAPSPSLNALSSQKESDSLACSKTKETLSLPPPNSTTSSSDSSNCNKPMVFIGPINPEDLVNLAKHIPSAAQSVFQASPKTSESVKIIHPNDIYNAKTNLSKSLPSTQNVVIVPPTSLADPGKVVPLETLVESKDSNSPLVSTSTEQQKNTNVVKGLSLLYNNANILEASNSAFNVKHVSKTVHNNVPIIFSPIPKSSSSDPLKLNITTHTGSNSVYSQSHLTPSPDLVSTVASIFSKQQAQQQVASVNNISPMITIKQEQPDSTVSPMINIKQEQPDSTISPMIKIKQELPDSTVSNGAPVVSLVNSQENVTGKPLVRLASFSNNQVNLKLGKFSNTSDAAVKAISTRVVSYVSDSKVGVPQFVKLTKIVDNICKEAQSTTSAAQPNQKEHLFFKVQQPGSQLRQVVNPSQQCILPKQAGSDPCQNNKNVKIATSLASTLIIPSTSNLIIPSHLTNPKSSNAIQISLNNSSANPASTTISDSRVNLGNLKSICQKEDDNPLTLKIDSIFSLRDNSSFDINTPKDNWKIKFEDETTEDLFKQEVSSVTNSKPVVTSTNSKPVVSSVHTSKVVISSVTSPKPVMASNTTAKPMVSSVTTLKPMVTSMTTSETMISSYSTPKVMVSSLASSKPMASSLFATKPVVSSLSSTTPVVTSLTNLQPFISLFPRSQSMVSIIPNQAVLSLLTNSQTAHSSLMSPKPVVSAKTSKPIISSVTTTTSRIFPSSNSQSTNSTKTPTEVNTSQTADDEKPTLSADEDSTQIANEENSSETSYGEISTQTCYEINSTETDYGEISTQTDYGENSTQTKYGENSCQTDDYELNSTKTDYDLNSTQTNYAVNSTHTDAAVNTAQTDGDVNFTEADNNEVNSTKTLYKVKLEPTAYKVKSEPTAYKVKSEPTAYKVKSEPTAYEFNSTQTIYDVNSTPAAYGRDSTKRDLGVNFSQKTYVVTPPQKVNSKLSVKSNVNEESLSRKALISSLKHNYVQWNRPLAGKPPVSNSYRQYNYLNPKPIKPKSVPGDKSPGDKSTGDIKSLSNNTNTFLSNPNMVKLIKMHTLNKKLQRENQYLNMQLLNASEKSCIKRKKSRGKVNKVCLKPCSVSLPRLYLPDGIKSVNVRKLNQKTLKSIRCFATCKNEKGSIMMNKTLASQTDSKVSVSYLKNNMPVNPNVRINNSKEKTIMHNQKMYKVVSNPLILPKGTSLQPNQRLLMVQIQGKNVLIPAINKLTSQPQTSILNNKTYTVQTSTPTTKCIQIKPSTSSQFLKTGSRFVNIAPNLVNTASGWNNLTNTFNLSGPSKPNYTEPKPETSDTAAGDDDVNSCLQLACGIIETNTLKRKSSDSSRDLDKRRRIIEMKNGNKKNKNYISSMLKI